MRYLLNIFRNNTPKCLAKPVPCPVCSGAHTGLAAKPGRWNPESEAERCHLCTYKSHELSNCDKSKKFAVP